MFSFYRIWVQIINSTIGGKKLEIKAITIWDNHTHIEFDWVTGRDHSTNEAQCFCCFKLQ